MATIIQFRRGTAARWTEVNPTLADGELGYEKDTKKYKIGDGVTLWNALAYISTGSSGGAVDSVNDQTGDVVLTTDNINDTVTRRYTNDTDISRLANTSGTNTGDQDISGIATNASAIVALNDAIDLKVDLDVNSPLSIVVWGGTQAQFDAQFPSGAPANYFSIITDGSPEAIEMINILSTGIANGQIPQADGSGNVIWTSPPDTSGIATNASAITTLQGEQTTQNTAIALNTAKRSYPIADETRLANTSGTNTGDQDISGIATNASAITTLQSEQITQNTAIALNTAKETNATHTGDATGATALTLQPTAISGKGANTGLTGAEEVLINNAGTLEKTTTQDIADLSGGGSSTFEELINQDFKELAQFNKQWLLPSIGANNYNVSASTNARSSTSLVLSGNESSFSLPISINYNTSATAGTLAFQRSSALQVSNNFDFHHIRGFFKDDTVADERYAIGLSSEFGFSSPTNVEPDTLTNTIAVCKLSTSNNLHVIHNNGTGTATTIDLGTSFPANDTTLYYYKLEIYGNLTSASVTVKVTRITRITGDELVSTNLLTTDLPNVNINPFIWITNNTTAAACNIKCRGLISYNKTN